jgi:hypothetical protein
MQRSKVYVSFTPNLTLPIRLIQVLEKLSDTAAIAVAKPNSKQFGLSFR